MQGVREPPTTRYTGDMRHSLAFVLLVLISTLGCESQPSRALDGGRGIDIRLVVDRDGGPSEAAVDGPGPDLAHDGAPADQGRDAPGVDTLPVDSSVDTTAPDSTVDTIAPLGQLTLAGNITSLPCTNAMEPAISSDGLTLHTRVDGSNGGQLTTRNTLNAPFTGCSASALSDMEDPTFFSYQGQERLIISRGPAPRVLHYCPAANTSNCAAITMRDIGGAVFSLDFDGPNVADGVAPLQMVFNAGNLIYRAEPTTNGLTDWRVKEILPITGGDPAISADGNVVLYETKPGTVSQINAIYRDANGGWSAPHHLTALDSGGEGRNEPDILTRLGFARPTYEIFYRGSTTIYHATMRR